MRWSILIAFEMVAILLYEYPVAVGRSSCHSSNSSVKRPYPNDCTRYYFCNNNEWEVKTCPEGYLFDRISYECLSDRKVECRSESKYRKRSSFNDKPLKRSDVYVDAKTNSSWSLVPIKQHRLPRAGSKTRASWTTYTLNGEPTHTIISFYQSDGPSYKIQIPGKLPSNTNVIEWVRQNGHLYEKEYIPYVDDNTPSNESTKPPSPDYTTRPVYNPGNYYGHHPQNSILLKPVEPQPQPQPSAFPSYAQRPTPYTTTSTTTTTTTTTTTATPSTTKAPFVSSFRPRPPASDTESNDLLPDECGLRLQDKILHGSISSIEDNPWQVALLEEETKVHICGGSIITNRHVLTAAHCFWIPRLKSWRPPNEVVVRVGDYDKMEVEESEVEFFIEELYRHTKYSASHRRNDIALITVLGTITFSSKIYPVCVPTKRIQYVPGIECIISGWGDTESTRVPKRYLRSAYIKIVEQTACVKSYVNNSVTRGMFCAGDLENGGVDTCQGDSGGPFVCKDRGRYYLYGITGWGIGCGLKGRPGVYTRVALYRDWIFNKLELSMWNQRSAQEDEDIF